jgi:ABC-type amino acid transport substrate-binding protein
MSAEERVDRRGFLKTAGVAVGVAAAAGVMVGCASGDEAASGSAAESDAVSGAFGNLIEEIKGKGKIVVGTTLRYPPQAYRLEGTDEPAGYDVEVAKLLAEEMEVELDLVDVEWEALLPGLAAGKYDTIVNGIANKPSRLLTMEFSRGYVPYDQWMLVRADETATDWREMNAAGKKITAQIGATAEYRARDAFPNAEIVPLKMPEAMLEVSAGRADGCVSELYLLMPFASQNPDTKVLAYPDEAMGLLAREWGCLPVRAGQHTFKHFLNDWVEWHWARGTLTALYDQIVGPTLRGEVTWG